MLPSSVSCKGKLYMDDWGGGGESRNLGNYGTGRQRTNKDHEDREELEQLDEEKASPIP